jgi:uncharacterized damage-inducible protein DinB
MTDLLVDVLFRYDLWATRRVLETCGRLSQAQFEQNLGLGHGSLERTLSHLVGAMAFFADRLNQTSPRPRPDRDGRSRTPAELLELFQAAGRDLREAVARCLAAHAMEDRLNWTDDDSGQVDPAEQVSYAVALAQMIDHGIHHRAQAVDMLRLLGVDDAMEWHPFEWDEAERSSGGG